MICDGFDINIWELVQLTNRHPRVNILNPGPGVGGHCIGVDPWFIISQAPKQANMMRMAREVNEEKTKFVLQKIQNEIQKTKNPIVACLGLSYKGDTNDLRESPSVKIVESLASNNNIPIFVVEPHIECLPASIRKFENIQLVGLDEALNKSNIVALFVDHSKFRDISVEHLANKALIDTKGFWNNVIDKHL